MNKMKESHTQRTELLTVARHTEFTFGLLILLFFFQVRSKAQRGRGSWIDPGETGKKQMLKYSAPNGSDI